LKYVLLDFEEVSGIDSSATYAFHCIRQTAKKKAFCVVMAGLTPEISDRLAAARFFGHHDYVHRLADLDHGADLLAERLLHTTEALEAVLG
jgi:SulP family sulfate permease